MDFITSEKVAQNMLLAGTTKAQINWKDLLIRGFLSGALLGFATILAITGTIQTGIPLIGALIFPVGFVMIILISLELVTGSFALVPLARLEKLISSKTMLYNLSFVFMGNLLGSLSFGVLYWIASTNFGLLPPDLIGQAIMDISEKKTVGYAQYGLHGMSALFCKAILCNWMVCMGVVMAMTSKSTIGKITAAWLPVFLFFALGFEHSVVNMFVIPAGILMGSEVTIGEWWLYNQIPVTIGNFFGGFLFTGMALYYTHLKKDRNTKMVKITEDDRQESEMEKLASVK